MKSVHYVPLEAVARYASKETKTTTLGYAESYKKTPILAMQYRYTYTKSHLLTPLRMLVLS